MEPVVGTVTCVAQGSESILTQLSAGTSAVAAVASVVCALAALWYSNRQIKIHDQHNRKMAQPHLAGWNHISHDPELYVYSLENVGLGPAVIKSIRLEVDGNQIEGEGADLLENATELLLEGVGSERGWEMFTAETMLPVGRKYELLGVKPTHHTAEDVRQRVKDRARLVIQYESILGDKFTFDSDLD
ncbi:hypothetical protein [Aquipseudomonas alcaligenes]|uniref:hypothetical protein n=1 Tax=Aquipseudomonas alcaligenes TaxID=43263 RepID=UPI00374A2E08